PYQFYSASCQKTYGRPEGQYLRPGEDERVAFCTSEFSDISPLSGGNVAFSTLEGRPSAYNFEESPGLQEWVTSTELLISLDRLNTFGDDIFKDPKVLQSYYYAVSDFSVGGRCKCNGHASECGPDAAGQLACRCQHNTTGTDCERCLPFFQDRPWARGTAEAAHECLPCNCSGRSKECTFDRELFRSTGHGGRCHHCRDHTAGPHCERCQENFYHWDPRMPCQPCDCHSAGSLHLQCDDTGTCACKPTVTGWKCDRCLPGFHSLSEGGCRPCTCNPAGSLDTCDPRSGRCPCKENVEGNLCDRCRPGTFNLQPHNPVGCSSCFCYGHSKVCAATAQFQVHHILTDFHQGAEGWWARSVGGPEHPPQWSPHGVLLSPEDEEELTAPEKFLGDQRFSYGQPLILTFQVPPRGSPLPVQLRLEGAGLALSLRHSSLSGPQDVGHPREVELRFHLQETSEDVAPPLPPFHFQRLLTNLTSLRLRVSPGPSPAGQVFLTEVRLTSARPGLSPPASWVETCSCPNGYMGQFCESCAPGYKRETPQGGPYASCVPCTCNQHGTCDPNTGICVCSHHTEGPSCERCLPGFYGNPFVGQADDCQPCPCPGQSACTTIPESGEVACTHCPPGQRGRRCEVCDDGFFGDPLGLSGPPQPCHQCQCSGNVDPNAVGNCDPLSGHCLRCLHNAAGDHCERCREGFYGSALAPQPADKCKPCSCHPQGSVSEQMPCDPVTGQCSCLPHVTGRDCSRCYPGFFDLQPGRGCRSCKCHPLGSQEDQCHPKTGQCTCRPGVTGQACDRCQLGFFGFSIKGCRACRCSPLGAASAQCHENGTCVCRPGFEGYKCDRCHDNFFLTADGTQCRECPSCYALVKEEAAKLKAKLTLMEGWLQGSNCGSPWGPLDILQGEAPRGERLPGPPPASRSSGSLPGTDDGPRRCCEGLPGAAAEAEQGCPLCPGRSPEDLHPAGRPGGSAGVLGRGDPACSCHSRVSGDSSGWSWPAHQMEPPGHRGPCPRQEPQRHRHQDCSHCSEGPARLQHQLRASLESAGGKDGPRDPAGPGGQVPGGPGGPESTGDSYGRGPTQSPTPAIPASGLPSYLGHLLAHQVFRRLGVLGWQPGADPMPQSSRAPPLSRESATCPSCQALPEPTVSLQPQKYWAEDLGLKAKTLEKTVASQQHMATKASRTLQAAAQAALRQTEPLTQVSFKAGDLGEPLLVSLQLHQEARTALTQASSSVQAATVTVMGARTLLADLEGMKLQFPRPKDQAALQRKADSVRDRLLADMRKKTKQAERMLGNAAPLSSSAKKKGREAEVLAKDSAKLAKALLREGNQAHRRASRLTSQTQATLQQASRQVLDSETRQQELEEAEQVGAGLSEMEQQIRESRISLEKDIEALSELLARLGSLDTHQAPAQALNETQWALERLRLQLASPGALQRKLRLLEQESELQELQIQGFESDLAEIRADKRNLEAILHSLPENCASWQ
ncbi:hypothetical protein H8959_012477, partial [Pygathrix nigripes]